MPSHPSFSIVVLISGNGSNLQAIVDHFREYGDNLKISAVVSNDPHAYGLTRAQKAGIRTKIVSHADFPDRETFDQQLLKTIDAYSPDLVVLAGFMRILTPAFVNHYQGRMLNIHPSLLPKFRGLNTHQRALDAGEKRHGVSIHFVTDELDGGPLVLQARIAVHENDTAQSLSARVQEKEHIIYPMVIQWIADRRLILKSDKVFFDGKPLASPLDYSKLDATRS